MRPRVAAGLGRALAGTELDGAMEGAVHCERAVGLRRRSVRVLVDRDGEGEREGVTDGGGCGVADFFAGGWILGGGRVGDGGVGVVGRVGGRWVSSG